ASVAVCATLSRATRPASLSLPDALPISAAVARNRAELIERAGLPSAPCWLRQVHGTRVLRFDAAGKRTHPHPGPPLEGEGAEAGDRESTRLNSSHVKKSYAVYCLKKKNK